MLNIHYKFQSRPLALLLLLAALLTITSPLRADDNRQTEEYYHAKVDELFDRNRWEEGKNLLNEALKYYPEASSLNALAGRYYNNRQEPDQARYFLIKAVQADPTNVRAKQLLIDIEENSGNYSSAICYVNELLEITPYWKGLWRRKIALYRKQGNDEEADRLLQRLHRIYPDDPEVTRHYEGRLEENYRLFNRQGEQKKAIATLQTLLELNTTNEVYYLDLCNLLLKQGRSDDALRIAEQGVAELPQSTELAIKKASLLALHKRYAEALSFISQRQKEHPSPVLANLHANLLQEAALSARQQDPYVLYGRIYQEQHDSEALNFLINESIARGRYEEALDYIAEARKQRGNSIELLYKEYRIHHALGNRNKSYTLLVRLYELQPESYDAALELSQVRMERALEAMASGQYATAIQELEFVTVHAPEAELRQSAWSQLHACWMQKHDYSKAIQVLETWCNSQDLTADYANKYEEASLPLIKQLTDEGALPKALAESQRLLAVKPTSIEGLRHSISLAGRIGNNATVETCLSEARRLYPADVDFALKEAAFNYQKQEYEAAVRLLRPALDSLPGNNQLVAAHSANSEAWGYEVLRRRHADSVLAIANQALVFDANNRNLLYLKGQAYEQKRTYDSAYYYQKQYHPANEEVALHRQNLRCLMHKTLRNEITAEYMQGRFSDEDALRSIATLSYVRLDKRNQYLARINYAARSGSNDLEEPTNDLPGGRGIQLMGEWTHNLNSRWNIGAGLAWANRYFPVFTAQLFATYFTPRQWELEVRAGWRRLESYNRTPVWDADGFNEETQTPGVWAGGSWKEEYSTLANLTLGAYKMLGDFRLGGKADAYMLSGKLYANLMLQARYYPLADGTTQVTLTAAAGSAPEASMIDYAMPTTFDKLNTMVSMGGLYMLSPRLTLGLTGEFHTFYTQTATRIGTQEQYVDQINTRYKNLLNLYVHLILSF